MFKKEISLKIATITLLLFAIMDLLRGFMHTFNVMYASETIAKMTQTPDTLQLMHVFGISNWLTAFIFILVFFKAKELAPYILIAIPVAYLIGMISLQVTGVSAMQESAWNGQYMMFVYLFVSAIVGANYFISEWREKRTKAA